MHAVVHKYTKVSVLIGLSDIIEDRVITVIQFNRENLTQAHNID